MKKCEFLSLGGEYEECFKECPFYEWDENDGVCPFEEEERVKIFEFDEIYKAARRSRDDYY